VTPHGSDQPDTPRSFWRDLEKEAKKSDLNPRSWYRKAEKLAHDAGKGGNDFVSESNFKTYWLRKRVHVANWHWSDGVQFFVQAAVGEDEEDWEPWQDRWESLRDQEAAGPEEREKTPSRGKWYKWYTIAAGIIGLIAAIVSLIVNLIPDSGQPAEGAGTQTSTANSSNPASGPGKMRAEVDDIAREAQSEQELIDKLRAGAIAAPVGAGPWPFVVVDTQREGAFARSTSEMIADRLGFAPEHSIVFAECQTRNSFTPPGVRRNVGPVWLRVRWKNTLPSKDSFLSDPSDPYTSWMYRGYLEPFGHNGEIPQCS
jgi:hypothetical protein